MSWAIHNRLFSPIIFLSGFSALIYQLIWVRLLGLVFGVSSFAVATVVAVFLLGLGLGSYFFGKWSEKTKNPLKIYMVVELAIAILSLLSYVVINHFNLYKHLYEYSYNNFDFYGISIIRLLLSIIVLLPPAFAIGGTMPLISKYFLTTTETLGSRFSKIYYMNTLGAFTGAILTGFVFVQFLGVFLTLMLAVAGNLVVAGLIFVQKSETAFIQEPAKEQAPNSYMLAVLFLTGFISLSYEILWVRILSTYGLSTSQSFALILAGFLLGFSIGAYLISSKIDVREILEATFSRVCILTAVSGALVLFLFQRFEVVTQFLVDGLPVSLMVASLTLAFAASFIPAIFMGILFPLGLRIYSNNVDEIGIKTGKIFFSNTAGAVIGSIATGFVLIPFAGMWHTTLILVNLSLLISVFIYLKNRNFTRFHLTALLVVFVGANLLVFSDQKTFHKEVKGFDVIYYAEGVSGTVTAIEKRGYRGLFVDGQNVSGTDPVLIADSKMLAHLPLLIAEKPESAVTVGYGTGTTSGSMLLHGVDVHAVEIEEKIIETAPLFGKVNNHSYQNPNLNIVMDDARSYLDIVDEKFDVIVTDVTNLKYKRNSYLYTEEYFEIMQNALTDKGIAAAWLPVGGLSFKDLKILIATFNKVYEHTTVWYFNQYPTHFIIVMGTPEKTTVNLNDLARDMKPVAEDLQTIQVDNEFEIASMLLLGEQDVDRMVAGEDIHTDNFPILEFSDMSLYMMTDVEPNLKRLLAYQEEDLLDYFIGDDTQLETLRQHFRIYNNHYRNYIKHYERLFPNSQAD